MKIKNMPPKESVTLAIIPTVVVKFGKVLMRTFTLSNVEYSIEEAVAIDGFFGYVHTANGEHHLGNSPIKYDAKGRPAQLTALAFTRI